ncbi:DUF349 domain-containing protein [Fibrobacter sp. UWP2]|uniref:DUF349 domain-containing protein n=1 Tax=Fibrobacter sp. UWP2 TaxID=1896216 RepID=UPI00091B2523|nr:DUF349 domain-containing protein [Fibrobacter sp. UWP2]SHI39523.1 protein of unknown function [Fibrobacter sp. UWP2]
MSLLDAFKPKWQNSNPEKRLEAIEELDPREQSTLERIALSDEDSEVRTAAVKKLTLVESLHSISKNDAEAGIRRLAENRYLEEATKKLKNYREPSNDEVQVYINDLKDSRYAEDLVKAMPSSELRMQLVKSTGKANVLAVAANRDPKEEIAKTAVDRIDSESLLTDISKNSKHSSIRKIAAEKLRAMRDAADGGKKAAALLISKREALIQQAHHLAAQKDPLAVKTQFEDLMVEASVLGMGPAQATLDEVYASFQKFCNEADAARIAAQKAEAEKQAVKAHLAETLAELENILFEGKAQQQEDRVREIIAEWAEKKSIMDATDVKRFNQAFFKVQDVKKKEAPAEEDSEEAKPEEAARPELLERLQALADTDANETTSKHLHAIVREWEKLPLLEGEDPMLQNYNSLRNKLSEKISSFNDNAQKIFEEKSAKLKALIERVKGFDENEDFKELSLKLRNAYNEWKEIVGEQKFKFHDLWLEYKAATERFQEMRQWESWHNENDRATILEDMEALSREPGSQEVLNKLKELGNKWKNCGPTSATKFVEFREKFQTFFDKIRENCAPFIEEQLAERQKNLESKLALCQKVEELVANTEMFWKDKFKAMQEVQESWKSIGMVPKESLNALMERFKAATNAFYAQHKENQKQEDANREANYEKKVKLCEEAEALTNSTDWNATSNKLKQLQEAWKTSGPVPKSKSDEIWTRFRTACDAFFEKKRSHFVEMDAAKQENLAKKTSLCEKLEALDLNNITNEVVEVVKAIEAEWKTIGMVPKESMEAINDRFSETINQFLGRCADIDENLRKQLEAIKKQKQNMIEKVKQFAESAGSNQLADAVRDLQKDWRALGSCGVDDLLLYKNFREVCDDFFTRRRDQLDIQEQARQNNLQKKVLLCEQAEDLLTDLSEATVGGAMNKVKHLRRLWKEVGAVPREHSDKIWKRFNSACDQVFAFGRKDEPKADAPQA